MNSLRSGSHILYTFALFAGQGMTARIIDGKAIAQQVRGEIGVRARALTSFGVQPCLAVFLIGSDPASAVYVRNKVQACEDAGIKSLKYTYPQDVAPGEVMAQLMQANDDPDVHGILVQLPLPPQFDADAILAMINVNKDVDGFHAENVGCLSQGRVGFVPCTPNGVMHMLAASGVKVEGKNAVVVGRSNIVGKPMAMLLLNAGATVTLCHSKTGNLADHTRQADILVAAVGRASFITADMVKPGAVVIDVGINRITEGPNAGKLCGDVDFDGVREVAGMITPVPGGVGPMTITMLLANTVESATRFMRQKGIRI